MLLLGLFAYALPRLLLLGAFAWLALVAHAACDRLAKILRDED